VLFDTDLAAAAEYGVDGIPQTVIIGPDGIVRKAFVGLQSDQDLRAAVDAALRP
jgi:hypothetical protein